VAGLGPHGGGGAAGHRVVVLPHVFMEEEQGGLDELQRDLGYF
jgi:hypothetical protein